MLTAILSIFISCWWTSIKFKSLQQKILEPKHQKKLQHVRTTFETLAETTGGWYNDAVEKEMGERGGATGEPVRAARTASMMYLRVLFLQPHFCV